MTREGGELAGHGTPEWTGYEVASREVDPSPVLFIRLLTTNRFPPHR